MSTPVRHDFDLMTLTFMLVAMLVIVAPSWAETLTYRASNNWVAQDDAKPLRSLLAQARAGKTHFMVTLPADRTRATARLEILRDLLEREAKTGIILEETPTGTAAANTLEVVGK